MFLRSPWDFLLQLVLEGLSLVLKIPGKTVGCKGSFVGFNNSLGLSLIAGWTRSFSGCKKSLGLFLITGCRGVFSGIKRFLELSPCS